MVEALSTPTGLTNDLLQIVFTTLILAAMADQQQPLKAPFPPPPPFYKHFTKANLSQSRQIRKEASTSHQTSDNDAERSKPDTDILSLPPELCYLIPPQLPAEGEWTSFAQSLSLSEPETTLASSGIEQLYPNTTSAKLNPQLHLLSLSRSLLTTFLALVGILSQNPTLYTEKVEDLQTICYNMHDLINQYRPHQARESLVLGMEERIQKLREEVRRIQEGREKVRKVMQGLREGGEMEVKREEDGNEGEKVNGKEVRWKFRQREMWGAIEREMGGGDAD